MSPSMLALLVLCALVQHSAAQTSAGSGCTMPTTCGSGGASAYVRYTSTSVAWSAAGRASVTMTSNQCPSGALAAVYNGVAKTTTSAPTCTQISLPFASAVDAAAPLAAPLRAAVGYTLWGTPIFAPSDDGIATGAACSNNAGSVVAGIDTSVEAARLEYLCGTANVVATALLDDCGGQAAPYRYRASLSCLYNANDTSTHSPIVGFALDGRGVYGKFEAAGATLPLLDSCGGHRGPTPAYWFLDSSGANVTVPAQANAYHYHVPASGPGLIGCFGVDGTTNQSVAASLYPTCGSGFVPLCTSRGVSLYDSDCPVFNQQTAAGAGGAYNMFYSPTSTCPVCAPNCSYPPKTTYSPTVSSALQHSTVGALVAALVAWNALSVVV